MSQRYHARSNRTRRLARKLSAYAAAGAVLAATKASASIVYTDLGADGVHVSNGQLLVDLDADGTGEFVLDHAFNGESSTSNSDTTDSSHAHASFLGGRAKVIGYESFGRMLPSAFLNGESIEPGRANVIRAQIFRWSAMSGVSYGPFANNDLAFMGLGVSFNTQEMHGAWVDLVASARGGITVFGYAYETEPGKPILAGDTGISPNVPGDTNGDGKVDITDLNNVRNNFGGAGLGDTNGSGTVDIEDLNAVRNNFGATSGANPVPEPPSLVLLAAGAAGLGTLRRKRAKTTTIRVAAPAHQSHFVRSQS